MPKPFKHFVITRFNLKRNASSWQTDKNNSTTGSDEWLEHRINLFSKYCLPSMKAQSNTNFTWLLYFDTDTPAEKKDQLEKLLASFGENLQMKYVDSYEVFLNDYISDVLTLASGASHVITSRIDNDDVLHTDYVQRIQEQFKSQKFMAVNFCNLYNLRTVAPHKLFRNIMFSNQFVSLIEKINGNTLTGCYARGDRFWNNLGEIVQVNGGPYCMELIHEKNLLNESCGFPVAGKPDLSGFQLPQYQKKNVFMDFIRVLKMPWKKFLMYQLRHR